MTRRSKRVAAIATVIATSLLGACTTAPIADDGKYDLYRQLMPKSILVLPPINESMDVNATYSWLTTVTRPIAEQGYYVYPVAIVDAFMKENGLPNPEDMHAAPLNKLGEVFGADAVLYVTLTEFGQKFEILNSTARVSATASLVDIKSGQQIWQGAVKYADNGNSNNTSGLSFLETLVGAAISQIGGTLTDRTRKAAVIASQQLFTTPQSGLLKGPRQSLPQANQ